jgi:NAD-dependent DNA ligase
MKPPREQVNDRLAVFDAQKRQARERCGDDTIRYRESDGVISIGGAGGLIIGGTDASAYVEPDPYLNGKIICFAGLTMLTVHNAIAAATAAGATVTSDLSGEVHILVAGPGSQRRRNQAAANGAHVWSELDFNEAMSGSAPISTDVSTSSINL